MAVAASSPSQIPLAGWRQILARTWAETNADQIPAVAAGVTFFGLLALFPALAAFVSLYGLFADVDMARRQILALRGLLPGGAVTVLGDQMVRLASTGHARLGLSFAVSFVVSMWSANAGVKALLAGLNVAYEQTERRGFLVLNAVSLGFTLGATLLALAGTAAVAAAPATLARLGLGEAAAISLLRWPVLILAMVGALSLLYRFGPCRAKVRWRWVTPGGVAASLGWVAMSLGFSWYVGNFGHYDATYGSLGAIVGFMTWIWLSLIVVLFGAELNAETERQTSVDTRS